MWLERLLARLWLRRMFYIVLVAATACGCAVMLSHVLSGDGLTPIEAAILVLSTITFVYIANSFWKAAIGFCIRLWARTPVEYAAPVALARHGKRPIRSRTAIIMPIYNEDPARVCAGLESTYLSLRQSGELDHFEFFLLSDSTNDLIAKEEQRRWRDLCEQLYAQGRIHYRRRQTNTGRKVGNIDDFCQRWGHRFSYMIVLDADSVMMGATIVGLVQIMEANERVGIVQTVALPVKQETVFARALQFGSWLCAELVATGAAFWQQGDGNYFGHNAIIRIQPFMEHCRLPRLPGNGPLSGEILSHDFVEAALMRRAGWMVWNVPDGSGSYEELPSNLIDFAKRDRRWCQGNMQHLALLASPGLHVLSRVHLGMGALAYLASPLWLLLIMLGLSQLVVAGGSMRAVVAPGLLMPLKALGDSGPALLLFAVTMIMLLAPFLFGMVLTLLQPARRAAFGGGGAVVLSSLLVIVLAALVAPVMMVFHALFLAAIFSGNAITWQPQARGSRALTLIDAARNLKLQSILGGMIALLVAVAAPAQWVWYLPLLMGLLLAAPLAALSSRADLGRFLRARGLLLTPAENLSLAHLHFVNAAPEPQSEAMPEFDTPAAVAETA